MSDSVIFQHLIPIHEKTNVNLYEVFITIMLHVCTILETKLWNQLEYEVN